MLMFMELPAVWRAVYFPDHVWLDVARSLGNSKCLRTGRQQVEAPTTPFRGQVNVRLERTPENRRFNLDIEQLRIDCIWSVYVPKRADLRGEALEESLLSSSGTGFVMQDDHREARVLTLDKPL